MNPHGLIDSLLRHARGMLDGTVAVPRGQSARLSSFLTRQALEEVVHDLCHAKGDRLDNPVKMRSRLIFIRARYGGATAALAEGAWSGLCEACHHHAYELTPTVTEVRHLLGLVSKLHAISG
jgi:hypothetical protein